MGYTHYWTFEGPTTGKKMDKAIADCNKIANASPVPLGNGHGEDEPVLRKGKCLFNGVGDDSHEGFGLEMGDTGFEFCKTAQKPYDVVVTACLIALQYHLGAGVKLGSDGSNDEWQDGAALCHEVLGYGGDFTLREEN